MKVKQSEKSKKAAEHSDSEDSKEALDVVAIYQSMVKLMVPGETVQKAIKRLGNEGKKTSRATPKYRRSAAAMKERREKTSEEGESTSEPMNVTDDVDTQPAEKTGKEDLLALIGYADQLLSYNGEMEIYQDTYEKLNLKVKNLTATAKEKAIAVDRGLDMFADDTVSTSSPASAHTVNGNKSQQMSGACIKGFLFIWFCEKKFHVKRNFLIGTHTRYNYIFIA